MYKYIAIYAQEQNIGDQAMPNEGGYIYVLTNPSFPEYVKIGYADNVDERVAQLNRSECTPFAFRKYATLHVASRLADKHIHKLIDTFKPELHAKENVNGKLRVREFFAMAASEAVELLTMIGSIYGEIPLTYASSKDEQKESKMATDTAIATERRSPFSFYKCGIKDGEKIFFIGDPSIVCYVVGEREINYNGEKTSLSALAKKLLKKSSAVQGTLYFSYDGEILSALRKRLEDEGAYGQKDEFVAPKETAQKKENNDEEDILYFVMSKYNAKCRHTANGFILLKGSQIAPSLKSSGGENGKKLREKYASIISPNYITLEDIYFSSSSMAAKFVAGSSLNGKLYWKTKDGVLLKDILNSDSN